MEDLKKVVISKRAELAAKGGHCTGGYCTGGIKEGKVCGKWFLQPKFQDYGAHFFHQCQ